MYLRQKQGHGSSVISEKQGQPPLGIQDLSRVISSLTWYEIPTNKVHSPGAINKHVSNLFVYLSFLW